MGEKAADRLIWMLYMALIVGAVWLTAHYVLSWVAPILVAFLAAAVMEPAVRAMVRHGWRRSVASGVVTLAVLAVIAAIVSFAASRGIAAATDFARQVPELMHSVEATLTGLKSSALEYAASVPGGVSAFLMSALDALGGTLYSLPGTVSQWALDLLARTASNSPHILLFSVTAGIGAYFVSASFPRVVAFVAAQLPSGMLRRIEGMEDDLRRSFGGWVRAQLILMGITFAELMIAFMLLKVKNPFLPAAVTALVDALPVFGTGIVLIPWAVYSLLTGAFGRGIGLIVCWGTVNLVRSCIQAKLLGDEIGLDPIASLLAIYVGWCVWGVWGMIVFPILLVTLCSLNDKGVLKLWKNI